MRPIIISVIATASLMWCGGQTFADEANQGKLFRHQYRTVTVEKIQSGLMFLGQPAGAGQRTVSIHKAERMGLYQAKKGDEVILVIDENNMLIDLHMKGVLPAGHRLITGELTYTDPMWEIIEISNSDGTHTLAMDEDANTRLSHLKNRELVWAELNEDNMVIGIDRLH